MPAVTEYLRRAVAPRIVVATSRARRAQSWRAALRRSLGLPQTLELFFAFDDPYAAIAMPGLLRIAEAHKARLILRPLLMRGIDGDPAALQRRAQHEARDPHDARLTRHAGDPPPSALPKSE